MLPSIRPSTSLGPALAAVVMLAVAACGGSGESGAKMTGEDPITGLAGYVARGS